MQNIAAELKHSETVFIKATFANVFELKYYTPNGKVALCGHATISAFTVLRNEGIIETGTYTAKALVGSFQVLVEADYLWMQMPAGKLVKELTAEESGEWYQAYDLDLKDKPTTIAPCIVNSGLSDILLPVVSKKKLDLAVQKKERVIELSRKYHVVGVHMFYYTPLSEITAYCRNFAPLYDIEEESATGTSNAALTYYLSVLGLIDNSKENIFLQGEAMGKPRMIKSKMNGENIIYIGGNGIISMKGQILL